MRGAMLRDKVARDQMRWRLGWLAKMAGHWSVSIADADKSEHHSTDLNGRSMHLVAGPAVACPDWSREGLPHAIIDDGKHRYASVLWTECKQCEHHMPYKRGQACCGMLQEQRVGKDAPLSREEIAQIARELSG